MLVPALLLAALAPPPAGQWAVDETGRVSAAALARFNQLAAQVDASGSGQLGLAVVRTTGGRNPRQLATDIFNSWGVGHAGVNDGVLLFFALDDRKAELVLGAGYPSGATATTDAIMREQVVANMKASRLDLAVISAAEALSAFVQGGREGGPALERADDEPPLPLKNPRSWLIELGPPLPPQTAAELDRIGDGLYAEGAHGLLFVAVASGLPDEAEVGRRARRQAGRDDVWVVAVSLGEQVLHVDPPLALQDARTIRAVNIIEATARDAFPADSHRALLEATLATAELMRAGPSGPSVSELVEENALPLGAGGSGFALVGLFGVRSWLRRRPRSCERCGNLRHRLTEQTDDPHLSPPQRLEEQLGSVDYDVWWCGRCNDALVLRYGAIFTRYGRCGSCDFKTAGSSSVTLVQATYDHGGTVEVTERCQNCSHVHTYTRHTARLTRSSSSSSSNGSSFGGGRSSGSGSSGSW